MFVCFLMRVCINSTVLGDYEKVSKSSIPDDVLANKTDYQFNYNDDNEWTSSFTEFEDSSYYDEHYTSDSDSDSSYDWDSGDSWDSGTTDWDSDINHNISQ